MPPDEVVAGHARAAGAPSAATAATIATVAAAIRVPSGVQQGLS
ncbi:MAG: hypothetical protein QME92_06620 [Bacillota bacterium]|nr:hypothetical protein [Bacillota bacterium]